MNRCTIFEFRNAIAMPSKLLSRLSHAEIDCSSLTRTRYFAECSASYEGREILIYAPIEAESLHLVHKGNIALQQAYGMGFVRLDILDDELQHSSFDSIHSCSEGRCPIVIERLPMGSRLEVVLNSMSRQELLLGLEELDDRLKSLDISHNNLTANNIIVDEEGRWVPIRQYYTRRGYGGDAEGFRRLRELIIKYTTPMEEVDISRLTPWPKRSAVDMDALFEGRRQITTGEGIGFEDEFGEVVIEPQYIWASNFMENRAMVRTKEGRMGVIDRYGRVIISTIYDSVEYSPSSGKSVVRCNNLYSIFDYNGKQLTQWHEMNLDRMEHK